MLKFTVVRASSHYNIILGRTGMRELRGVSSTVHAMVKFPTPKGIATLIARTKPMYECRCKRGPSGRREGEANTYVSQILHEAERNYASLEKLALCLLHLSRRLRRYFKAHPIKIITDQPVKQILNKPEVSRKLAKYTVELDAYNITYVPRNAIKGQVLADFINEIPMRTKHLEVYSLTNEENTNEWIIYTYEASSLKGVGAGLVLINPSGIEYTYAIRLTFASTNNEVEYESLLAGLWIAHKIKVQALKVKVDSKLVACQMNDEFVANSEGMEKYLAKAKEHAALFKIFLIENIPQNWNQKADVLSKLASVAFNHLTKEVLVEVLNTKSMDSQENKGASTSGALTFWDLFQKVPTSLSSSSWRLTNSLNGWRRNRSLKSQAHRTMLKTSNDETPFSLTYGSKAIILAEIGMQTYWTIQFNKAQNEEEMRLNLDLIQERQETAAIREAKYKKKVEQYYNKRVRPVSFKVGDFVYRRNEASRVENQGKLGLNWEGPYQVIEAYDNDSYKLCTMNDREVPRTWHAINLWNCFM
ncbi:reverse transcriptase domain-containing protein [Tanacetum coccineum]